MKPVNEYMQVEEIDDESVFKTSYDNFAPQPMKILKISSKVELDVKEGDTILTNHVYEYRINKNKILFVKDADIVAVINEA